MLEEAKNLAIKDTKLLNIITRLGTIFNKKVNKNNDVDNNSSMISHNDDYSQFELNFDNNNSVDDNNSVDNSKVVVSDLNNIMKIIENEVKKPVLPKLLDEISDIVKNVSKPNKPVPKLLDEIFDIVKNVSKPNQIEIIEKRVENIENLVSDLKNIEQNFAISNLINSIGGIISAFDTDTFLNKMNNESISHEDLYLLIDDISSVSDNSITNNTINNQLKLFDLIVIEKFEELEKLEKLEKLKQNNISGTENTSQSNKVQNSNKNPLSFMVDYINKYFKKPNMYMSGKISPRLFNVFNILLYKKATSAATEAEAAAAQNLLQSINTNLLPSRMANLLKINFPYLTKSNWESISEITQKIIAIKCTILNILIEKLNTNVKSFTNRISNGNNSPTFSSVIKDMITKIKSTLKKTIVNTNASSNNNNENPINSLITEISLIMNKSAGLDTGTGLTITTSMHLHTPSSDQTSIEIHKNKFPIVRVNGINKEAEIGISAVAP